MNLKKTAALLSTLAIVAMACFFVSRFPVQELKVTAMTESGMYDVSGIIDVWHTHSRPDGRLVHMTVTFQAVPDTNMRLFTKHGSGQYVNMGCERLSVEQDFLSFDKFLHLRLTMYVLQSELKLEDGMPFDVTRYSLKPVIQITEK